MDDPISYRSFSTDVDFIRGGTLERFLHDPSVSKQLRTGYQWYWVYEPSEHMLQLQCDDCAKRHNPKNINCSATLHAQSKAVQKDVLYKFTDIDNVCGRRFIKSAQYVDYGRATVIKGCIVSSRQT
jgi:hypothetical protein